MVVSMKTIRKKHGLTQNQLGRRLGISGSYVYSLENGRRTVPRVIEMALELLDKQLDKAKKGRQV